MIAATVPLYHQINAKFEDSNYVLNTQKEMGCPDCLRKAMYVVGPKSKIPVVFRKIGSAALTIIGIITILPAIFWTVKSCVEFAVLPVSSRILRNIMRTAREQAIMPSKKKIHDVINTIKVIAKIALITTAVVVSGYALGLGMGPLIGIGIATFLVTSLYKLFKAKINASTADIIKSYYTDHITTGPKHLRMSVMVDGERIDTYVVMHHDKIEVDQRWILATNGNGVTTEFMVGNLINKESDPTMLTVLANKLKANVVTYNYGGCLASEGQVTAAKAARVYQAMKKMIEDPNGLAAKEIVFYGHSIGAAFQAKGLQGLTKADFDANIRYICVKDRTFANSDDQLRSMFPGKLGRFLQAAVKHFGWTLNVKEQCEELYANKIPQVNINHEHDSLMRADGLVQKYSERHLRQDRTVTDTTLLKSFKTKYVQPRRPAVFVNGKKAVPEKKPAPHMDATSEEESDQIVQQINTMLAFNRRNY